MNRNFFGLLVSILLGPVILFVAKFILGANLLDGIGNGHSNDTLQESVLRAGTWAMLAGMIAGPMFSVKLLRGKLSSGFILLIGLGSFIAPFALFLVVFGLPS